MAKYYILHMYKYIYNVYVNVIFILNLLDV